MKTRKETPAFQTPIWKRQPSDANLAASGEATCESAGPVGALARPLCSASLTYEAFEQMAQRSVQTAIDNSSMSPPEGYEELEGKTQAVADDCFLAGIDAMKTAMLNEMFDLLRGNGADLAERLR